jgi:Anti-sigma-28 factor, FlgM
MSSMSKDALARAIAQGEYVVDAHAVAEAMLRRGSPLAVLVPAQPLDRPAAGVEQDDALPGADVA